MGIPGVTVKEKGTNNATFSNENGEFSLNVAASATLVFTSIGYETVEAAAKDGLSVTMPEVQNTLEELVVVGFGTQKKKDLTGAVSQVSADQINNRPVANIGQALQGVIPNLNINISNGSPNTNASFNVRGITSLNSNDNSASLGSPLILVDGVPGDMSRLNPEDIESVTVLKDAAASAIYGARAAFGVLLVTTKSGTKGQSRVDYSNSFQWSSPTAVPDILSAYSIQEGIVNGYVHRGLSAPANDILHLEKIQEYMNDPVNQLPYYLNASNAVLWRANVNPYDETLAASAPMQKHNLSINGGTDKITYYGSIGFQNQDGIYRINTDNLKRYNLMLNLNSQVNKWFNMGFRTAYNNSTYNEPVNPAGKGGWWTAMSQEPNRNVFMPVKTPASSPVGEIYTDNIVSFMEYGSKNTENNSSLVMTLSPKVTLTQGWNVRADVSYKNQGNYTKTFVPLHRRLETNWNTTTTHTDPSRIYKYDFGSNQYTINAYTDYIKTFAQHHNVNALVGFNQEWYTDNWFSAQRNDVNPNIPTINQAQGLQLVNDGESHWAVRGLFYRLEYDYKGKYLLKSNGRYDGTSRFSTDTRYKFFPSFSAGWVLSEESFAEGLKPVVNFLKLRASYGSLGNQNVSNYAYVLSYNTSSNLDYLFGGVRPVYVTPPGLLDANLTWETSATLDFGLDVTLFRKWDLTFDWYKRTTSDILAPADQLPVTLGTAVPLSNSGMLTTKGWEVTTSYKDATASGIRYDFTFTLSDYQSKVTRFNGNKNKLIGSLYEGMTVGEIWGYETYGLFQTQEEINTAPSQSKINSGIWFPGDVRYVDRNGDGEIFSGNNTLDDSGDRTVIGNSTPRFAFGLNSNLRYKGFDVNLFLQGIGKRDLWIGNNLYWGAGATGTYEVYNNSWTPERTDAHYPLYYNAAKNRQVQTRYLENGAYLRVKNISVGYTLPNSISESIKFKKLRVFGSAFNLLEFKSLPKTFDPEVVSMAYPIMRSYAFGIQASF